VDSDTQRLTDTYGFDPRTEPLFPGDPGFPVTPVPFESAEQENLYKLALAGTDTRIIAAQAVAVLDKNTRILSAADRLTLIRLHEMMDRLA
jgi:hypothetical protein